MPIALVSLLSFQPLGMLEGMSNALRHTVRGRAGLSPGGIRTLQVRKKP